MHKYWIIISILFASCKDEQAIDRKIIDTHFHAFAFDEYGYPPPPNEISGIIPAAKSTVDVQTKMLEQLVKHNVKHVIASGHISILKAYQQIDKKRFIGGYYFSPRSPLPDTTQFIKLIDSGVIKVLGELGLQYAGLTLTDSMMIPYLKICDRYGIPIALHTGLGDVGTPYNKCCPGFRTHLGNPQIIEEVLVKYPNLKVQLMHGGWPYIQEVKALLYMYPQVNVDVAVINWALPVKEFHNYLEQLITAGFSKRIMYGSDQMIWEDAIKISIDNIESANFLTTAQKEDIFFNNAKLFFNIKD